MPMYFVHNSAVNSHTGNLAADRYTEQVFNDLGGSYGCYAGDESPLSAKAQGQQEGGQHERERGGHGPASR